MKFKELMSVLAFAVFLTGCANFENEAVSYMKTVENGNYAVIAEDLEKGILELSCDGIPSGIYIHKEGATYLTNYWGAKHADGFERKVTTVLNQSLGSFTYETKVFANRFDDGKTTYTLEEYMLLGDDTAEISVSVEDATRFSNWEDAFRDTCVAFVNNNISITFTLNAPTGEKFTGKIDAKAGAYSW